MRVLLLTGPVEGGIRRHVEALIRRLPGQGVECGLAAPAAVAPDAFTSASGRHAIGLTDRFASALAPRNVASLVGAWRRGRWDLLHAHGYKASALAAAATFLAPDLCYVATVHNLCPRLGTVSRWITRLAIGRARRQIVVSAAILKSLQAVCVPAKRAVVIPNGIDWQRFDPLPERHEARVRLGLDDRPAALFLGRLTQEKGVLTLARAAELLLGGGAAWQILIAGDGPEKERLMQFSRATASLRLLGHREDIPYLLAACDVVVTPSLREGQSLVALEALAAGRPLIASDIGGLAELARASGAVWLVPPGDPAAFAAALEQVRRDAADRDARIGRGKSFVRQVGDWEQMTRRVAAVYREAVSER